MNNSEDCLRLAREHRAQARREALPQVRALLAASAEKWEFLAATEAAREVACVTSDASATPDRGAGGGNARAGRPPSTRQAVMEHGCRRKPSPDGAAVLRQRAETCRWLAQKATNPRVVVRLKRMASGCDRQAERLEGGPPVPQNAAT